MDRIAVIVFDKNKNEEKGELFGFRTNNEGRYINVWYINNDGIIESVDVPDTENIEIKIVIKTKADVRK